MKNPLLRWPPQAIARVPASIHAKLLAAFLAIAGLLIAVSAVGIVELRAVNEAAEDLVKIQRKIAAYRQLQHDTTAQLYSVASALLVGEARALEATLRQLNQFGYDLDRLQFVGHNKASFRPQFIFNGGNRFPVNCFSRIFQILLFQRVFY